MKKTLGAILSAFVITRAKPGAIANGVLDPQTGRAMEYRHLIKHKDPKSELCRTSQQPTKWDNYFRASEKEIKEAI